MGLGETLVAGDLLRRGRAPHLVAADATAGFVPGNLGRRAWPDRVFKWPAGGAHSTDLNQYVSESMRSIRTSRR